MSIDSQLNDMKYYLSEAFDALEEISGVKPDVMNLTTLLAALDTI